MIGVYKITSPSGKIYIGQSINYLKRLKYYNSLNCKCQPRLYNSLLKYGINNHIFEFIEQCLFEELNVKERYYQDLYEVIGENGLNCVLTETNKLKSVVSDETRVKISKGCKGRIISETHRNILKDLYTNVKRDPLIGVKISEKLKGRKLSENHILNLKKSHIGYKYSKERKLNASLNCKSSKKIISVETGEVWNSIKKCAEFMKTSQRTLRRSLNGESLKFPTLRYY